MKKENIILSIIIPIYNSFSMIEETLISFEKMSLDWVEFVMIDDYSTDDSFEKLLLCKKNSSLNIIACKNESNLGPGETRNLGVIYSNGKYITFLDADDKFSDSFFKTVRPYLDDSFDCILFDATIISQKNKKSTLKMVDCSDKELYSKLEYFVYTRGAPWGKIYRKNIIIDNNIVFLKQKRNEDMPFTKVAISKCENFKYLKIPMYYYIQNSNSLIHNKKLNDYTNVIRAFDYINKNVNSLNDEKEALFISEVLYTVAILSISNFKRKQWIENLRKIESIYPNYIQNKYLNSFSARRKVFIKLIFSKKYYLFRILLFMQNVAAKIYR